MKNKRKTAAKSVKKITISRKSPSKQKTQKRKIKKTRLEKQSDSLAIKVLKDIDQERKNLLSIDQDRKSLIKHLDDRLQNLYDRAAIIERQLLSLGDNRFYRTCIFGSARIKAESKLYTDVYQLARLLAWEGIDVLTGGGPGLMEAANKGALFGQNERKTKSKTYGLSIELPFEPDANNHLDVKRHHQKFSSRLDDFMRLSNSIICTPGGIGTVLELFFSWQLIQVKHISKRPIVLMGKDFWTELIEWMKNFPLNQRLVSPEDFDVISIVDSAEEAALLIAKHHNEFRNQTATKPRI